MLGLMINPGWQPPRRPEARARAGAAGPAASADPSWPTGGPSPLAKCSARAHDKTKNTKPPQIPIKLLGTSKQNFGVCARVCVWLIWIKRPKMCVRKYMSIRNQENYEE